jgi:hypothetical protein
MGGLLGPLTGQFTLLLGDRVRLAPAGTTPIDGSLVP